MTDITDFQRGLIVGASMAESTVMKTAEMLGVWGNHNLWEKGENFIIEIKIRKQTQTFR